MLPPRADAVAISASTPGRSGNSSTRRSSRPSRSRLRSSTLARMRGSILPPQIGMPTRLPAKRSGNASNAATPAAPAPSATCFAPSASSAIACLHRPLRHHQHVGDMRADHGERRLRRYRAPRCPRRWSGRRPRPAARPALRQRRIGRDLDADHLDARLDGAAPPPRSRRSARRRRPGSPAYRGPARSSSSSSASVPWPAITAASS